MKNYPLYLISLCFAGGILLQFLISFKVSFLIFFGIFSLLFFVFSFFRSRKTFTNDALFGISCGFFFVSLGMWNTWIHQPQNIASHYSHVENAEAKLLQLKITELLKPSKFQTNYLAEVKLAGDKQVTGKVLLHLAKDSSSSVLQLGSYYLIYSSIKTIEPPKNPYQFDYSNYMKNLQVYGQIVIDHDDILGRKNSYSLTTVAGKVRSKIIANLKQSGIQPNELGIIQALILGQRQELSKEITGNFAAAGVMHLLAVSGLHIGILLILLRFLFKPLKGRKYGNTIYLVLIISSLWLYAFLTGLSPSVLRAVTMFSFLAIGLNINRKASPMNSLFTALLILLFFNPFLILQAGFQLSFLAVFSILLFYPIFRDFWQPKQRISRYFRDLIAISFAAQLGVLPLSIFYFHQFPALFFVSNLVILPFTGILMALGLGISILAIVGILPAFLGLWYAQLIAILENFVIFMASWESVIFTNIYISIGLCLLLYGFLFNLYWLLLNKSFIAGRNLLLNVLLIQVFLISENFSASNSEMIIYQSIGKSIFSIAKNNELEWFTSVEKEIPTMIIDYANSQNLEISEANQIPNYILYKDQNILILDSLGIYNLPELKPDIIVLTHSPKINLERLLQVHKPKIIIADASNYNSFITRWKKTLSHKKIPFHNTSEKGFYKLKN